MSARGSWTARPGRNGTAGDADRPARDLRLEDLLDARFDDEGRLADIGRGARQRSVGSLQPRPPAMGVEDLERAVERLARGLEAMERTKSVPRDPLRAPADPSAEPSAGEFVTYGLDRLEARLDAISRELERRAGPQSRIAGRPARHVPDTDFGSGGEADSAADADAGPGEALARFSGVAGEAADSGGPETDWYGAGDFRNVIDLSHDFADREHRVDRDIGQDPPLPLATDWHVPDDADDEDDAGEEATSLELRLHLAALESRVETLQERGDAEELARVRDELHQLGGRLEKADRTGHVLSAHIDDAMRRIAALEAAIALAQANADDMEDVRARLVEIESDLQQARGVAETIDAFAGRIGGLEDGYGEVETIRSRMGAIETSLVATRNLAGNRLGELQERIAELAERLEEYDANPQIVEALREGHAELMQRIDRFESIAGGFVAPDDLQERLAEMGRSLERLASQEEVSRIEARLLSLADRFDAFPADLAGRAVAGREGMDRIVAQLQALAADVVEARRRGDAGGVELADRIGELAERIEALRSESPRVDMEPFERRFAELSARLDRDRRAGSEIMAGLDARLAGLAALLEREEDDASQRLVAEIDGRIETLLAASGAQDRAGIQAGFAALEARLAALADTFRRGDGDLSSRLLKALDDRLGSLARAVAAGDPSALREDVAALDKSLSQMKAALGSADATGALKTIDARLDALGKAVAGNDTGALKKDLAGLGRGLAEIRARIDKADGEASARIVAALDGRIDALAARLESGPAALGRPGDLPDERLAPVSERLSAIENCIDGLSARTPEARALHSQLDGILHRLERIDSRSFEPDRLLSLVDRLEAQLEASAGDDRLDRLVKSLDAAPARFAELVGDLARPAADGARMARLEEKLDLLAAAIGADGERVGPGQVAGMRSDIAALRRELRSLSGQGDGEAGLAAMIRSVTDRLESLSERPPVTGRDLDDQVERIAQLLDNPDYGRSAMRHVEASLRAIENRLAELGAAGPEFPEFEEDEELSRVGEIARSLSGDLDALREATNDSDRKTRDSLDSVQDTLEAVVKRMAFLERDGDPYVDAASDPAGDQSGSGEAVHSADLPGPPDPAVASGAPGEPAFAYSAFAYSAFAAPHVGAPEGAAEQHRSPAASSPEAAQAGIVGRLTSSQILKRATGGRADSFSPVSDESDDPADLPLEPGTEEPLDSALGDAPSSDTVPRHRAAPRAGDGDQGPGSDRSGWRRGSAAADNFLASARRAAQAAAAEVAEAERQPHRLGRLRGLVGRTLFAGVLGLVMAMAAYELMRVRPGEGKVGAIAGAAAPARSPQDPHRSGMVALAAFAPPAEAGSSAGREANATATPSPTVPAEIAASDAAPAPLPAAIGPAVLRDSALGGDAAAEFEIAVRYAEGRFVARDVGQAIIWFERAAARGLAPAAYRLGSIYENGTGVAKDLARARENYRRATEAGNVAAMHNLAVLYAEGAGDEQDLEAAAALFRRAAGFGVRDSQFNIAILSARADPQGLAEAYKWFAIAAATGDTEARNRLEVMADAMSPAELEEAKAAAEAFVPRPPDPAANIVPAPEDGWGAAAAGPA